MSAGSRRGAPPGGGRKRPGDAGKAEPSGRTERPKARRSEGAPAAPRSRLAVLIDGRSLPDDEARELWMAFSQHMEEHPRDTAGFARARGWTSVVPEYRRGQAVLVITTVGRPSGGS